MAVECKPEAKGTAMSFIALNICVFSLVVDVVLTGRQGTTHKVFLLHKRNIELRKKSYLEIKDVLRHPSLTPLHLRHYLLDNLSLKDCVDYTLYTEPDFRMTRMVKKAALRKKCTKEKVLRKVKHSRPLPAHQPSSGDGTCLSRRCRRRRCRGGSATASDSFTSSSRLT